MIEVTEARGRRERGRRERGEGQRELRQQPELLSFLQHVTAGVHHILYLNL